MIIFVVQGLSAWLFIFADVKQLTADPVQHIIIESANHAIFLYGKE